MLCFKPHQNNKIHIANSGEKIIRCGNHFTLNYDAWPFLLGFNQMEIYMTMQVGWLRSVWLFGIGLGLYKSKHTVCMCVCVCVFVFICMCVLMCTYLCISFCVSLWVCFLHWMNSFVLVLICVWFMCVYLCVFVGRRDYVNVLVRPVHCVEEESAIHSSCHAEQKVTGSEDTWPKLLLNGGMSGTHSSTLWETIGKKSVIEMQSI